MISMHHSHSMIENLIQLLQELKSTITVILELELDQFCLPILTVLELNLACMVAAVIVLTILELDIQMMLE